jgi:Helix-turn-helix domain
MLSDQEDQVKAADDAPSINPRVFGLTKAAYSVNETLDLLSLGRTSLYKLVTRGILSPAKLGKKTLFCAPDIAAFLVNLRAATHASTPPTVEKSPQPRRRGRPRNDAGKPGGPKTTKSQKI